MGCKWILTLLNTIDEGILNYYYFYKLNVKIDWK